MGCYGSFSTLCSNLRMSESTVENVRKRYRNITKRINEEYWNSSSETDHSLYVGSYGRGTSIYTSDIDVVVILPNSVYDKFNNYSTNGQSALLQDVKDKLKKTYPMSNIKGDGQVVSISFYDGITFEIVPAFKRNIFDSEEMTYPDTNDGGSWKKMKPQEEIDAFNKINKESNGNLKRFCRMLRAWNSENNVHLKGCYIDFFLYDFFRYERSLYTAKSYSYYDYISRDVFKYLKNNSYKSYYSPSHLYSVSTDYPYTLQIKSEKAYNKAVEGCDLDPGNDPTSWSDCWRYIYGDKFPQ